MGKPPAAGRESLEQRQDRPVESRHVQTDGARIIPVIVKRARGANARAARAAPARPLLENAYELTRRAPADSSRGDKRAFRVGQVAPVATGPCQGFTNR